MNELKSSSKDSCNYMAYTIRYDLCDDVTGAVFLFFNLANRNEK